MDHLLSALKAIAEPTRLRIVALCGRAELTVSDIVGILGQSQPRVSRHLKLLVEAGLLERHQEGSWARYRLTGTDDTARALADAVVGLIPDAEVQIVRDRERLERLRTERVEKARAFFARNAQQWAELRALHIDAAEVDRALVKALSARSIERLIDIGTGTGHVLKLMGPTIGAGVGIDRSPDMLDLARTELDSAGLFNCQVRQADIRQLPFDDGRFDAASLHMVLHFLDDAASAVSEAARVLASGGRLVIVDFAPHDRQDLVETQGHVRLGIADDRMADWLGTAGLVAKRPQRLKGGPLTVVLWIAEKP